MSRVIVWTVRTRSLKYSGYDPEIGSFNQNPAFSGIDNGRYQHQELSLSELM
jgi:hypothetical protein